MKKILFLAIVLALACLCFASCSCDNEEYVTVKFESHVDGVKIGSQSVAIGSFAKEPEVSLDRAGYKFLGWYDGDKKWDFAKNVVEKDMTISAKWESYLSYAAVSEIESNHIKGLIGVNNQDGVLVTGCDFDVENVVIPTTYNGKRVVGIYWAFSGRTKIKSVVIPEGVVFISQNAFNKCENLKQIVIPSSVMVIQSGAFYDCASLEAINCRAESKVATWDKAFNAKFPASKDDDERYNVVYGYKD